MTFAGTIDLRTIRLVDGDLEAVDITDFLNAYRAAVASISSSPQQKIAISSESLMDFAALFFACVKLGRDAILLGKVLAKGDDCYAMPADPLNMRLLATHDQASENGMYQIDLNTASICVIFYTSGSTGEPKSIVKTFAHFLREIEQHRLLDFYQGELVVSSVAVFHMYGFLFRFLGPVALGVPLYLPVLKTSEDLARICQKFHPVLVSSPAFLKRLDVGLHFQKHPQVTISSGSPLPFSVAAALSAPWGRVHEVYGSSETGGIGHRQAGIGQDFELFDGLSVERSGEDLLLHSPFMAEIPFVLDDEWELLGARRFRLVGRKDRIAKIEDFRVSLPEVEGLVLGIPGVTDCFALVMNWKSRQHIAVVIAGNLPKDRQPVVSEMARKVVSAAIGPVAVPKQFLFVDQIPVNEQGKICRQALVEQFYGHS